LLKKIALLVIGLVCTFTIILFDNLPFYTEKEVKRTKLEQIKATGVLNVLTRLDPTSYYSISDEYTGLEYDLVMLFAKHLGVKVNFQVPEKFSQLLADISDGKADIAAAGLTITATRKKTMRFSSSYQKVTEQIIYRSGTARPKKPEDLKQGIFEVVAGSSHVESLRDLKQTSAAKFDWTLNDNLDSHELIHLVNEGLIDYTVADSNQTALLRRFYPKLHIAFDITKARELAWGLKLSDDDSLYNEVQRFFKKIKQDNTLAQLLERHYGHVDGLNYVAKCKFFQHQKTRLPEYKPHFIEAAKKHNLDWRLLAAIGYQESHWRKQAKSPTGVKGLMMLTRDTAKLVGIKDRTDPIQSIRGGALYFYQRLKTIPARIQEPDRTWLALASYNIGFGHLEDARILAQRDGKSPDKWLEVKKYLPLLTQEEWYSQTKYGYARGNEPIHYVENIRNYYDLLVWTTQKARKKEKLAKKESNQGNKFLRDLVEPIF